MFFIKCLLAALRTVLLSPVEAALQNTAEHSRIPVGKKNFTSQSVIDGRGLELIYRFKQVIQKKLLSVSDLPTSALFTTAHTPSEALAFEILCEILLIKMPESGRHIVTCHVTQRCDVAAECVSPSFSKESRCRTPTQLVMTFQRSWMSTQPETPRISHQMFTLGCRPITGATRGEMLQSETCIPELNQTAHQPVPGSTSS